MFPGMLSGLFAALINLKAQGAIIAADQEAAILRAFLGHIPFLEDVVTFPIDKHFNGDAKPCALLIVENDRDALREHLQKVDWMSESTQESSE